MPSLISQECADGCTLSLEGEGRVCVVCRHTIFSKRAASAMRDLMRMDSGFFFQVPFRPPFEDCEVRSLVKVARAMRFLKKLTWAVDASETDAHVLPLMEALLNAPGLETVEIMVMHYTSPVYNFEGIVLRIARLLRSSRSLKEVWFNYNIAWSHGRNLATWDTQELCDAIRASSSLEILRMHVYLYTDNNCALMQACAQSKTVTRVEYSPDFPEVDAALARAMREHRNTRIRFAYPRGNFSAPLVDRNYTLFMEQDKLHACFPLRLWERDGDHLVGSRVVQFVWG